MKPHITTAPGRIDLHVAGERFTSYELQNAAPGFTVLHATGLRPVTQPDAGAGLCLWLIHGNVNGMSFGVGDPEDPTTGRIVTRDLVVRRGSQSVGFLHECDWVDGDAKVLLHEARTVRVANAPSSGALLDLDVVLQASADGPLDLGITESSLVCCRVAPSLMPSGGGQLRNSSDDFGPQDLHGRPASWVACTGVVQGETVGMAFLEHPDNPWYPSPWIVQEDGRLSPSPFAWRSQTLPAGRSLALRYRILVQTGYVEAGWIRARMVDWLRE